MNFIFIVFVLCVSFVLVMFVLCVGFVLVVFVLCVGFVLVVFLLCVLVAFCCVCSICAWISFSLRLFCA